MAPMLPPRRAADRGQTLVETALILPVFILIVVGIMNIGIGLYYQQQVTTAAREAARYAAVHSASSNEPTCGWLTPEPATVPSGSGACADDPASGWPEMTAHARQFVSGMDASQLHVTACWAGYRDLVTGGKDAGPYYAGDPTGATANTWADCTMEDALVNPLTQTSALPCPASTTLADGNDTASNLAVSASRIAVPANRVVVYACYEWTPPMAGFLGLPETFVLRAVISEALQHQR